MPLRINNIVVMYGQEMFVLHEARELQTDKEIRDFRGGAGVKFFRPMKTCQQASNLNHPIKI